MQEKQKLEYNPIWVYDMFAIFSIIPDEVSSKLYDEMELEGEKALSKCFDKYIKELFFIYDEKSKKKLRSTVAYLVLNPDKVDESRMNCDMDFFSLFGKDRVLKELQRVIVPDFLEISDDISNADFVFIENRYALRRTKDWTYIADS